MAECDFGGEVVDGPDGGDVGDGGGEDAVGGWMGGRGHGMLGDIIRGEWGIEFTVYS